MGGWRITINSRRKKDQDLLNITKTFFANLQKEREDDLDRVDPEVALRSRSESSSSPSTSRRASTSTSTAMAINTSTSNTTKRVIKPFSNSNCDNANCKIEMLLLLVENLSLSCKIIELEKKVVELDNCQKKSELEHESFVKDLHDNCSREFECYRREQEVFLNSLVDEILQNYGTQMDKWKNEFLSETQNLYTSQNSNNNNNNTSNTSLSTDIWNDFQSIRDSEVKGLIVIGIIIVIALCPVGVLSWRFINWAWPRILTFSLSIDMAQIVDWIAWITRFLNSEAYAEFLQMWERGEPVTRETLRKFGPDIVHFLLTELASLLFKSHNNQLSIKN